MRSVASGMGHKLKAKSHVGPRQCNPPYPREYTAWRRAKVLRILESG
jgi:hypothetical protein